jgi:hypothetical protein
MSRNLGALTSWNPVGLFRPVMGQLVVFGLSERKFSGVLRFRIKIEIRNCLGIVQEVLYWKPP